MMTLKTILLMLSLLAASLLLQTAHAEAAVPVQVQKQQTSQSVILDMQNMTCALCKFTIKKALQGVEGVEKANVDYDSKTASVTFNSQKTSVDALIKATTAAGYPATVHPTNK
jgi:periplasmic mercuric ion binding protein